MPPDPRPGGDDVERDDAQALSRATRDDGGEGPDADSTTRTGDSETFVGRVAGQDVGYAGETARNDGLPRSGKTEGPPVPRPPMASSSTHRAAVDRGPHHEHRDAHPRLVQRRTVP
jgi:hypothetical protein